MASPDRIPVRLFKAFLGEVMHVTTPEIVLGVVLAFAALAYKHFYGGGLSWTDTESVIVPPVWACCALGCIFTVKAAIKIRKDDRLTAATWKPRIHGNFSSPPLPSIRPLVLSSVIVVVFFALVFVGSMVIVSQTPQRDAMEPQGQGDLELTHSMPSPDISLTVFNIKNNGLTINETRLSCRIDRAFDDRGTTIEDMLTQDTTLDFPFLQGDEFAYQCLKGGMWSLGKWLCVDVTIMVAEMKNGAPDKVREFRRVGQVADNRGFNWFPQRTNGPRACQISPTQPSPQKTGKG